MNRHRKIMSEKVYIFTARQHSLLCRALY